ncbi:ABC transporter permease [bacterium]|nr:ABC transporter permease [bacterium]
MSRKTNTFKRILKNGAVGFTRNFSLAAAAIAVMSITLTVILFSILASATFNNTISQIRAKVNVSVYLKDGISKSDLNNFTNRLKEQKNVKSISYISKDKALAIYKAENSNNASLMNAVSAINNPLPASIEIIPVDINNIQAIKTFIDQDKYSALIDPQAGTSYSGDRKQAIDKIANATKIIKEAGAAAVAIFSFVSVIIIFNTIRMAIFNRRDEIKIMRLLGANKSYIHGPFVVEGIIYGLMSGLISMLVIYILFAGSANTLQATSFGLLDISYAENYFKSNLFIITLIQLGVGMFIGAISSAVATRRYLKNKIK